MHKRTYREEDYDYMRWMNERAGQIAKDMPLPFRKPNLTSEAEDKCRAIARREAAKFPSDPFYYERLMHYFKSGLEDYRVYHPRRLTLWVSCPVVSKLPSL